MRFGIKSASISSILAMNTVAFGAVWSGTTDNDWYTPANWTPSDVPDSNTETATFSATSASNAPNLGSVTTIGRLEFLSGAGSYTLSGSGLTVQGVQVRVANSSGLLQTVNNNFVMNATTTANDRRMDVSSGSTLAFGGTFTANGGNDNSVGIFGAGTVNFGGNISANQIQQQESITVNINSAVTGGSYYSFSNAGRLNFNATTTRAAFAGTSGGGSGRIFVTTNGVSIGGMTFRAGNSAVNTLGADIAAGGTGSVGTVTTENATRTNATHILSASAGNVLNVTGVVSGGGGAGTKYQIQGAGIGLSTGVVRFSGAAANTTTVPIEVASGRLELNKTAGINAIASSLSVVSGGEARLLAGEQIANAAAISLAGTFNTNGFSETAGALTLSGTPVLDLGAGASTLTFASLAAFGSGLTINNWTEGVDSIVFSDPSGFTQSNLAAVNFTGFEDGARLEGNQLVPVPEPSALIAGIGFLGLALRRRRSN